VPNSQVGVIGLYYLAFFAANHLVGRALSSLGGGALAAIFLAVVVNGSSSSRAEHVCSFVSRRRLRIPN
jgi:hypothetical protein